MYRSLGITEVAGGFVLEVDKKSVEVIVNKTKLLKFFKEWLYTSDERSLGQHNPQTGDEEAPF